MHRCCSIKKSRSLPFETQDHFFCEPSCLCDWFGCGRISVFWLPVAAISRAHHIRAKHAALRRRTHSHLLSFISHNRSMKKSTDDCLSARDITFFVSHVFLRDCSGIIAGYLCFSFRCPPYPTCIILGLGRAQRAALRRRCTSLRYVGAFVHGLPGFGYAELNWQSKDAPLPTRPAFCPEDVEKQTLHFSVRTQYEVLSNCFYL